MKTTTKKRDIGRPEYGKLYALTGATGKAAIFNGNTWAESEVRCVNCNRLSHSCGKCTEKNCDQCKGCEKKLTPYAQRVLELEAEGLTTSDAQGVADLEHLEDIV